jgi:hypothetical protein
MIRFLAYPGFEAESASPTALPIRPTSRFSKAKTAARIGHFYKVRQC